MSPASDYFIKVGARVLIFSGSNALSIHSSPGVRGFVAMDHGSYSMTGGHAWLLRGSETTQRAASCNWISSTRADVLCP